MASHAVRQTQYRAFLCIISAGFQLESHCLARGSSIASSVLTLLPRDDGKITAGEDVAKFPFVGRSLQHAKSWRQSRSNLVNDRRFTSIGHHGRGRCKIRRPTSSGCSTCKGFRSSGRKKRAIIAEADQPTKIATQSRARTGHHGTGSWLGIQDSTRGTTGWGSGQMGRSLAAGAAVGGDLRCCRRPAIRPITARD